MKRTLLSRCLLFFSSLALLAFVALNCAIPSQNNGLVCGTGYELTSNGCQPSELLSCNPACKSDEKCEKGKCVPRYPPSEEIVCATPCDPGYYCDTQQRRCLPTPCSPACKAGESCVRGRCALRDECNPPCPQFGYICETGLCKKLCIPECATGLVCIDGICQKACTPACTANQFCQEGACKPIEDADKDGFPNNRDCDDKNAKVNPSAPELCNKLDDNCDGLIDNIEALPCYEGPAGTLGRATCKAGIRTCKDGVLSCEGQVLPKTEACNGQDDDCDGQIDNNGACNEITPDGGVKD